MLFYKNRFNFFSTCCMHAYVCTYSFVCFRSDRKLLFKSKKRSKNLINTWTGDALNLWPTRLWCEKLETGCSFFSLFTLRTNIKKMHANINLILHFYWGRSHTYDVHVKRFCCHLVIKFDSKYSLVKIFF